MTLALLALLLAAPEVHPRALEVYPHDDPDRQMKARIETMMGTWLVDPPRRHPSERVVLQGSRVRLDVWQPIGRNSDSDLKTRAVEWLVFGRLGWSSGARGVFSEFRDVSEVMIVFHEVLRPDKTKRRRKLQQEKVSRYLALKLTRRRFEEMQLAPLRGCVDRGDCAALFKSGFDDARFNGGYVSRRRAEEES